MRSFLKIIFLFVAACLFSVSLTAQQHFSLATDLGVLRSFKKEQRFFTFGHTVHGLFHFSTRDAFYLWVSYYRNGTFENTPAAIAKSSSTNPQSISYTNDAEMRLRHFSAGWRRYLKGNSLNESSHNIYGYAGFGILFGRIQNNHSVSIDTSLYDLPVQSGSRAFKRLTLDLGLGWETPLGNALFFYTEGRAWIPTTDYPSKHLFVNHNAPVTGMLNAGLRILFD